MTSEHNNWSKYAKEYDPIKCGSIDGCDNKPHDNGIVRALNSKYTPNKNLKSKAKNTIFVGRLHVKTTEETLIKEFKKFGKILRCNLVRDIVTGFSKQYAFIEFENLSSAVDAIYEMQRKYIDDCEIVVEHEYGRTMKGWKPRRLGGGFGGKKESGQLRFGGRARPFQKPVTIKTQHNN